ncbi:hypothetical protein [Arthrobacter caoxuetaonis]|uniref:Uncharacterized protein n=1 Tax=Arthrobacter caoxuetaonis TaxID=2886935 RepID=A0A9X1MHN3_9MICC|nr:hypothetical protein [Arthrobacter caoxuetaonis]MCC3299400.1 hypothetical protein [Arthrobacter caoxuetaonis]USQ59107.1 hypothetical protein NF551_18550 [Arthrobacter caoxuetaonis]
MTTPALASAAHLNGRPLTRKEVEGLPPLSVVLNTELNPHAWQKRLVFTDEGARRHQWFCTTDADWGETSERLIEEHGDVILLWLPSGAEIEAALRRADLAD